MNVGRLAVFGIALVAGAAAFFLMLGDTENSPAVQIIEPLKEETVRVLVATRDIGRGERFTEEDSNWISWPKKAVQETFITDEDAAQRDALVGSVARSLVVKGEPIVNAKIVRAGQSGLMAAIISPGMRAVTLRVSPETSSGGFILPGDMVDILFTLEERTTLMFEKVRVLAVNTVYSEHTETPHIDGVNVTLEMTPRDAQSFVTARGNGNLDLVLRSIFTPTNDVTTDRRSSDVTVIRYGRS